MFAAGRLCSPRIRAATRRNMEIFSHATAGIAAVLALHLALTFSHAAEPPADVAKLAAQLAASDRDTRREAGHQLEKLGPAAKPALPALIAAIGDSDKQVWANALAAIAAIGPDEIGRAHV